ncbi:MAG: hypothetical protein O3B97_00910 [Actinomycetota bacterium]|nr:hypothetical protein [Thermoleophilia bacterium]MDA3005203.1 hypothetical protein [Actinomycetota bacterium]
MNYLKSLERRERLLAVAILNGVFIISLFFEWGAGGARAWDADSVWLPFLAALIAGLIALADAFDYEVPRLPGSGVSAYLTSITLIYTIVALMDIRDQSWGIIVSLIVSIVATFIAFGTWRADRD